VGDSQGSGFADAAKNHAPFVCNCNKVENNPVNLVDPLGLFELPDVFGTGTIIDAAGAAVTKALENAGKIGPGAATTTGIVTAPLSDFLLPNEANPKDSERGPLQNHEGEQLTSCLLSCLDSDSSECGEEPDDCIDRCTSGYSKRMKELTKVFPR
jgi:hypothetical protein